MSAGRTYAHPRTTSRLHILWAELPAGVFSDQPGNDVVVIKSREPIPAKVGAIDVIIPKGVFTWPQYVSDEPLSISSEYKENPAFQYELRGLTPEYKQFLRKIDLYVVFANCSVIISRGDVFCASKCVQDDSSEETQQLNNIETSLRTAEEKEWRAKAIAEYGSDSWPQIAMIRVDREFYDRAMAPEEYWNVAVPAYSR